MEATLSLGGQGGAHIDRLSPLNILSIYSLILTLSSYSSSYYYFVLLSLPSLFLALQVLASHGPSRFVLLCFQTVSDHVASCLCGLMLAAL